MYKRIVLAFDGSVEGRTALREGAILARQNGAAVFLLSVIEGHNALSVAEGAYPGTIVNVTAHCETILQTGVAKLRALGFLPEAKLVVGEPAQEIAQYAREVGADLVVVGHRRRTPVARWWAGGSGDHLSDHLHCTLLVARNEVADTDFEAVLDAARPAAAGAAGKPSDAH